MAAPQVSWRTRDNSAPVSKWLIGTIDAGDTSAEFGVLIWNNYGGAIDLSTMTNCTITTKDASGNNAGELVIGKWIEVMVDSDVNSVSFLPIGGETVRPIQAGGNTTNTVGTTAPSTQEILGVANGGSKVDAKGNFAEVSLRAAVPGTATAGNVSFLTRVSYQYV